MAKEKWMCIQIVGREALTVVRGLERRSCTIDSFKEMEYTIGNMEEQIRIDDDRSNRLGKLVYPRRLP